MRHEPTEAEKKLWQALRNRRFSSWKFRRQVPLGRYIADFLCFEQRLIIEVDGGQHNESAGDLGRDAWLGSQGYRTRRFWNSDVLMNLEGVLSHVECALGTPHPSRRRSGAPPSPARGKGTPDPFALAPDNGVAAGENTDA